MIMMPLTLAGVGEVNTIRRIGGNEETRRFLENLGFVAGSEITVLSAIEGNVIVNIKDSRIAINKDMARHIICLLYTSLYTNEYHRYFKTTRRTLYTSLL